MWLARDLLVCFLENCLSVSLLNQGRKDYGLVQMKGLQVDSLRRREQGSALICRQVGNTQDSVGHIGASSIISTNERSLEDFM